MNVLHDEFMMPKICKRYDIGYKIHNISSNPDLLYILEPWCDTIYTDATILMRETYIQHEEQTSKFKIGRKLRDINATERLNNIILEFDAKDWKPEHYKFIENLMFMIEDSGEVGDLEYDIFKIHINSMESYESKLIDADDPWYVNQLR
jgi:hypothetical protein